MDGASLLATRPATRLCFLSVQAQLAVFLLGSSYLALPRSGFPQSLRAPPSTKRIISIVCQSLQTTGRKRRLFVLNSTSPVAVQMVETVFSQAFLGQRLNGVFGGNLCQFYKTQIPLLQMSHFISPGLRFFTC